MIKMLNHGGRDLGSVGRHLQYLDRDGDLPIGTDDGEPLKGKGRAGPWSMTGISTSMPSGLPRPTTSRGRRGTNRSSCHKMIFSMPAGTPPEKVLKAVKVFAREEFGARHRYAMVLHTD